MTSVSNTVCVLKGRQKQKVCFSHFCVLLSTFATSVSLWVVSGLNHWQQEEKSARISSCWKLQYCRCRDTDSLYYHLSILIVNICTRQSAGLPPPKSLPLLGSSLRCAELDIRGIAFMQCCRNAATSVCVSPLLFTVLGKPRTFHASFLYKQQKTPNFSCS